MKLGVSLGLVVCPLACVNFKKLLFLNKIKYLVKDSVSGIGTPFPHLGLTTGSKGDP